MKLSLLTILMVNMFLQIFFFFFPSKHFQDSIEWKKEKVMPVTGTVV